MGIMTSRMFGSGRGAGDGSALRNTPASTADAPSALSRTAGLNEPPKTEPLRTGFGKGTISAPGAAMRTLNRGLESARQAVPDLQEVFAEQAARRDEAAQARRDAQRAAVVELLDPSRAVRSYLNTLNQAAETAQARVTGEAPPTDPRSRATIQVNGQTMGFVSRDEASEDVRNTDQRLNLLG